MSRRKLNGGKLLRGFSRVHLKDLDGNVVLERTMENTFTDLFRTSALSHIGIGTSSDWHVSAIAIGTGTATVSVSATSLVGELTNTRAHGSNMSTALDNATAATRLRVTGVFEATANTGDIACMGLHTNTTTGVAGLLCGNIFSASFAKASNQTLSVTYDITFSS